MQIVLSSDKTSGYITTFQSIDHFIDYQLLQNSAPMMSQDARRRRPGRIVHEWKQREDFGESERALFLGAKEHLVRQYPDNARFSYS
jgi:hypothetical protein